MIKFERIGVNFQYDATSIEQANKSFSYSCDCCCSKGIRIDCDHCAISHAHSLVVAYFNDNKSNGNKGVKIHAKKRCVV